MTAKQIAIDGPAGAGKSTIAKIVAEKLGYLYVDTGAMYRAVAWLSIQKGIAEDDEAALAALMMNANFSFLPAPGGCRVLLGEQDISKEIRFPEVGNAASAISVLPEVRRLLVERQQNIAANQPVVMDGRDIGTVVLPKAECKIFLTATPHVRAIRRTVELKEKGLPAVLEQIEAELLERDYRDTHREHSPLKQAEDAILIDSSDLGIEEVVEKVLTIAGR